MVTVAINVISKGKVNELYTVGIETSMPFDEVRAIFKAIIDELPKVDPPEVIPGIETQ
jgi:vancomycin permeability regulator SanA